MNLSSAMGVTGHNSAPTWRYTEIRMGVKATKPNPHAKWIKLKQIDMPNLLKKRDAWVLWTRSGSHNCDKHVVDGGLVGSSL